MPAASKQPDPTELERDVHDLKQQLDDLRAEYVTVMGLSSISRGLSEISEYLAPLKRLVPRVPGEPLDECRGQALATLQKVLARPDWTGVGSLGITEPSLGFIGEPKCSDSKQESHGIGETV